LKKKRSAETEPLMVGGCTPISRRRLSGPALFWRELPERVT
jgi:hypothetical protein